MNLLVVEWISQQNLSINPINCSYLTFLKHSENIMEKQIKQTEFEMSRDIVIENNQLPSKIHQILLGSLLGDMYCRKECLNSHIEESHSIRQKDYLTWKYFILKDYFDLRLYFYNNPICKAKEKIKEYNNKAAEKRKKVMKN